MWGRMSYNLLWGRRSGVFALRSASFNWSDWSGGWSWVLLSVLWKAGTPLLSVSASGPASSSLTYTSIAITSTSTSMSSMTPLMISSGRVFLSAIYWWTSASARVWGWSWMAAAASWSSASTVSLLVTSFAAFVASPFLPHVISASASSSLFALISPIVIIRIVAMRTWRDTWHEDGKDKLNLQSTPWPVNPNSPQLRVTPLTLDAKLKTQCAIQRLLPPERKYIILSESYQWPCLLQLKHLSFGEGPLRLLPPLDVEFSKFLLLLVGSTRSFSPSNVFPSILSTASLAEW